MELERQDDRLVRQNQLRVALFSGNYNYQRDGANQALNRLVGYLERQGVAVRVYSPTSATPAFEPTGTLVSVPSFKIPTRGEYRFAFGLPEAIRRDIRAFAPTLIHLSAPDRLGFRAKAFARELGVPVVASVHTRFDTYLTYYGLAWVNRFIANILRRFYGDLAEVYAPSESMAEVLRADGMAERVSIWSRGVDRVLFNPARRSFEWRRAQGFGDDQPVIAFVGRLVLEKGLDVFADTIALLMAQAVPHRVLIVGEGPARAWVEERLPEAVYTGHLAGTALAQAYASADMLFNPSITETFGNVTLEAMASGLPVVAARATGSTSLVEDGVTGRLAAPGCVPEFASVLRRYLVDATARTLAGRAGLTASARYDWDDINQGMLDHYLNVVGAPPSRCLPTPHLAPFNEARFVRAA